MSNTNMMLPNMCCMQCLPIATPGNNLHFWFPFLPLWYAFYPYVAGSWLWPREGHKFMHWCEIADELGIPCQLCRNTCKHLQTARTEFTAFLKSGIIQNFGWSIHKPSIPHPSIWSLHRRAHRSQQPQRSLWLTSSATSPEFDPLKSHDLLRPHGCS